MDGWMVKFWGYDMFAFCFFGSVNGSVAFPPLIRLDMSEIRVCLWETTSRSFHLSVPLCF